MEEPRVIYEVTIACDPAVDRELREWLQARIDAEDAKIKRLGERIVKAMTEYKEAYKLETEEVDASLAAAFEYRAMLEALQADDLPRFGELGVIAAMQPVHCTSDAPWVPQRLGPERAGSGAYVWRDLLDSGATIVAGTDAPSTSAT